MLLTSFDEHNMKQMEYTDYTRDEMLYHVKDPDWQALRVSLKGLPTSEKLQALLRYLDQYNWTRNRRIQVNNYLDALRRGGQLPPRVK